MLPILTAAQMRACDKYAIDVLHISALQLMENAALALWNVCKESNKTDYVVILAGKGNNGGDGYCLADILIKEKKEVYVIAVNGLPISDEAQTMMKRFGKDNIIDISNGEMEQAIQIISKASLIVDCIYGTGFKGEFTGAAAEIAKMTKNKYIIACDVPSGINCDTGFVQNALKADITVTFGAYKPYCFLYPAKNYTGKIVLAPIGIPKSAIKAQMPFMYATDDSVLNFIKKREENSHKGTYGGVQLVCGSKYMIGAAVMAAKSALRSGVGLVYITINRNIRKIMQTQLNEPVFVKWNSKTRATAFVIGCGLGKHSRIIKKYSKKNLPGVLDADALTYLSKRNHMNILRKFKEVIITPHPLEMSRLTGKTITEIENDIIGTALDFAKKYEVIVVLKGRHTIIATPEGTAYINTSGNSGLSKGGSGDILSGLIGGLLAQGYSSTQAAILGVYLHGKAADNLIHKGISQACLLPTDLPFEIGNMLT